MRFSDKLRRKARQNKAVITSDPEALEATLQVTKRLLTEAARAEQPLSIIDALHKAIPMSAPIDSVRTFWSALRVIMRHTTTDKSSLSILADAAEAQGKVNLYATKGPQA